jgi:DNA modification methylase
VGEGLKFGIDVNMCKSDSDIKPGINITNYEKLHNFDPSLFVGVVADESGIFKSFTGKIKKQMCDMWSSTKYRLSCTATPSPNDFEELGNQAEFLGICTRTEMLSMFFINDTANTGTWRLKKHAVEKFWQWVCTWAIMIQKPSDMGYPDDGFILPELKYHSHVVKSNGPENGKLWAVEAKTLTERRQARKNSIQERCQIAADIINKSDDIWLVWCDLNDESKLLTSMINDAVEVTGSDSDEHKETTMMDFAAGNIKVMVSKPKIAGWGMNLQVCSNMVFVGLSDSFEAMYQAVRRCYRFGQKNDVNVHIITHETEGAVVRNIQRKEKQFIEMTEQMAKSINYHADDIKFMFKDKDEYNTDVVEGDNFKLYNADCIDVIKEIPSDSIHYSIFSPPFASLFVYSNSDRDMGNCKNESEFYTHFRFLVEELYRVIMPGRLVSFHCMNLPATISSDGYIGMKDFRGDLIRLFQEFGFIYHSEVCIWKDPLVQATRTKVLTLAHKQISKDSSRCGQGFPDYVVTMRKPGENPEPVAKGRGFEQYIGDQDNAPDCGKTDNPRTNKYSHHVWQRYASPVWFDIRQTRTLNEKQARDKDDERHMCPLQLDTIERCLELWSNPGDVVFSPFLGIGSEGYCSLQMDRKFIGIELKKSYFDVAVKNIIEASSPKKQMEMFNAN